MLRRMSSSSLSSIGRQLKLVCDSIQAAAAKRPENLQYVAPRLVAVSKTKSVDMIIDAYDAGQRHFGENYVVELYDKGNDIELQDRCEDIKWHFIGHLQRNKVSKLLDTPNLYVVETVDSERLAKALNDTWAKKNSANPLNIMVQVNTSGEDNKSGCPPGETLQLVRYVQENCPDVSLLGLMTIGSFDHDLSTGPNPDFLTLVKIREEVCSELGVPISHFELSMGMSADYEHAIELGSTNVRVGSTIFGARNKPQTNDSESKKETTDKSTSSESGDGKTDVPTSQLQSMALS